MPNLPLHAPPLQAQAFCPRFDFHADVPLLLDASALEALATQHLCLEVWHHTSRSLAVALAATAAAGGAAAAARAAGGTEGGGEVLPVQDVLLGCGGEALSSLLLKPQVWAHGICWAA